MDGTNCQDCKQLVEDVQKRPRTLPRRRGRVAAPRARCYREEAMRACATRRGSTQVIVALVAGFALLALGGGACGGGQTAVRTPSDAAPSDATDARDPGDARSDAPDAPDARAPGDGSSTRDVGATDADAAPARGDGPASDARVADAADGRVEPGVDAPADAATQKPPATADWTLSPFPLCTAAGAGCMDTGAVGGYQITASGACPTDAAIQLWFPGGAAPVAAGAYAVKSASGILDVIAMPAGMVGVLAERDDASMTQSRFWGRSGSVTVTASGTARHVTFSGVSLKEETSSAAATLSADVTCP